MPYFQTPVHFAHHLWASLLRPGMSVIDATCGNGHDTLFLAQQILQDSEGSLLAIDIQPQAIRSTKAHLKDTLPPNLYEKIEFHEGCHSALGEIAPKDVDLVVYNLGYLPKSDKSITTHTSTTLDSLNQSLKLLKPGGILSVTCYPGHEAGEVEAQAVSSWGQALGQEYSCCELKWTNRSKSAPFIVWIEKRHPRHV